MKQKLREVRNQVEAAGYKMAQMNLEEKKAKQGKDGLREALRRAQTSSASSGKVDRRTAAEKRLGNEGKKAKVNSAIKASEERDSNLKLMDKMPITAQIQKSAERKRKQKLGKVAK